MDAAPAIATITTTTTSPMEDAMETTTEEAPVQQEGTAEEHALRHTKPSFDYAIGKDVHDHHFSKTAQPLSTKERERLSELGFNNPVGTTHNAEGFISHSAQRALLRSLDHAKIAHEAETMEVAALMGEFDALVQECGAMKTRMEHEHFKTALGDATDLHARLMKLQEATKHVILKAEREAALWRGAELKKEARHQHEQQQQPMAAATNEEVAAAAPAAMGEN